MIIKICGLKRPCDIEYVNELKPDCIGFIFAPGRRRTISKEEAKALKAMLDKDIKAVGVFVDSGIDQILELLNEDIIDVVQLHGDESEEYIKELKSKTDAPVIKAFIINEDANIDQIRESAADVVLLDGGQGSGKTFNLELIGKVRRPYILAGGLSVDNIVHFLMASPGGIIGVDVSSAVETDGFKDYEKIKDFIHKTKSAAGG